jgi:hypothetical protein
MNIFEPFVYLKNVKFYKNKARKLEIYIKELLGNKSYTIWSPSTSRLWPFLKRKCDSRNIIEHGLGEYVYANQIYHNKNLFSIVKGVLKYFFEKLYSYELSNNYDKIFLCNKIGNYYNQDTIQIDVNKFLKKYIDDFWVQFNIDYPKEMNELKLIKDIVKNNPSNFYLYLPSDEIRYDKYPEFLKNQLSVLNLNSSHTLILKKHPADAEKSYAKMFENSNVNIIEIAQILNSYIPVEFVAYYLGLTNVIGTCSSAIYYLKCWLPNINIIQTADFDNRLLKLESKNLISQIKNLERC